MGGGYGKETNFIKENYLKKAKIITMNINKKLLTQDIIEHIRELVLLIKVSHAKRFNISGEFLK